jgi:hypothetical protein
MMTYVRNNGSHLATEALVNFILPFAIKIAHMPGSGRFERYWPRTSHRRVGFGQRHRSTSRIRICQLDRHIPN